MSAAAKRLLTLTVLFVFAAPLLGNTADALAVIKRVGKEGAGHVEAARAWNALTRHGPDALIEILTALDEASPRAANWLRTAVDAIAENTLAAGKPLPADQLLAFVKDRRHAGRARRLAYEWLVRVDPKAPDRLVPEFVNDPAAELRRDAVALLIKRAHLLSDNAAAKGAFQNALHAARDRDQVQLLADCLKKLGVDVDLNAHFGFLTRWTIIGPFDSTGGVGFHTKYPPDKGIDLKASYPGKDKKPVRWIEHVTGEKLGLVDFNKVIGPLHGTVAYALAAVHSDVERPVEVRAASNNAIRIALNGKEIFFREEYHHGMQMDQHVGRGVLKKGRNEILLKVCQNEQTEEWAQNWSFQLRICDALGGAVPVTVQGAAPGPQGGSRTGSALRRVPPALLSRAPSALRATRAAPQAFQFRGPGGLGVSLETRLPVTWNEKDNIRWKVDLPGRGLSNPVIAEGRVFVTAASGWQQDRLHVLCFDLTSGNTLWERQLWATGTTLCNPKTNMAAPTPCTDGQHIFALFATCDLAAFDRDGNLLWYRSLVGDYPTVGNNVGMAASPILWNGLLIHNLQNVGESFAVAIDTRTGENRWRVERPRGINWVTPLVIRNGDRDEVLFQDTGDLTAHDPSTGKKLWSLTGQGFQSIPSPTFGDGLIYTPASKFLALRPGSGTDKPGIVWQSGKHPTGYSSPVLYRGKLYTISHQGVLNCSDAVTAQHLWAQRVEGNYAASPLAADGKIYVVSEEGSTTVVAAGPTPKILATNPLGETLLASPVAADGAIFLRSDRHLWCIGNKR